MDAYTEFLARKRLHVDSVGFQVDRDAINPHLFPFQRDACIWALNKGRAAIFFDTGLGKSLCELEIAQQIVRRTGGRTLILAPLAVAQQTKREGEKFGYFVTVCKSQEDVQNGINITNYERLHLFDLSKFVAVLPDEASIMKSFNGKTTKELIERCAIVPYRFPFTATPAPNDHEELGNYAEFLGVMTRADMLSMFFTHDGGKTQDWRLKGHAHKEFWQWVAQWGLMLRSPADAGYDASRYQLPPLVEHQHVIEVEQPAITDSLFALEALTLTEQRGAKRNSMASRVAECAEMVKNSSETWLIWCELNDEGDALEKAIPGAVQIAGSDKPEVKEQRMVDFTEGRTRVLVSKSSICGFGMNWQHCANMAFVGVSHSYEQVYQAIRRCYRFGQEREVNVHFFFSEEERAIWRNLKRKEQEAEKMAEGMMAYVKEVIDLNPAQTKRQTTAYTPVRPVALPNWIGASA